LTTLAPLKRTDKAPWAADKRGNTQDKRAHTV
jgi:hypothetical protein